MHIPDGFIDGKTAAVTAVLAAAGVGVALRRVKRELPPRKTPLLGLAAAFVFAAQMINFPVVGGTSGHLIGGVLVAALLGPSAAIIVITTVLIVQCYLFNDGGVLSLGANVFNMAIVSVVSGYAIYRPLSRWRPGPRGQVTAVAFAGWCSTVIAAISCAGQLAWSGTTGWAAALTAMTGAHMLIGIGEGLISALALLAILRTRPDMVAETNAASGPGRTGDLVIYGGLIVLGLALFVAPFACSWPDGLEAVAGKLGFEHQARPSLIHSPVADYHMPGVHWAVGATALAGVLGSLIVFALALLLGRWLVPVDKSQSEGVQPNQ